MISFFKILLQIFYPIYCEGCGKRIEKGFICPKCKIRVEDFRYYSFNEYQSGIDVVCALYRYESSIKESFHKLKYARKISLLKPMSEELIADFKTIPRAIEFLNFLKEQENSFVVVPIPTDQVRRIKRGYDIPERLFRQWAKENGYLWINAMKRNRRTNPQFGLDNKQRCENVKDCFEITKSLAGKSVILVDDIYTTGATMREAAKLLKRSGVRKVIGIAYSSEANLR